MKTCPECQKNVSRKARTCPHCGHPMVSIGFITILKWLFFGFVLLIALLTCAVIQDHPIPRTISEKEPNPEDYAITMSWQFVKDALKSPSTAKFGRISEHRKLRIEGMDNAFEIHGHVDSQNSFGAAIRSHFICRLQYVGDNSWRLIALDIY